MNDHCISTDIAIDIPVEHRSAFLGGMEVPITFQNSK